jgi:hypothetical protein
MVEPHRQQPLSGHMLVSAVATASAQMSVQIGNRLGHPRMVGVQDRPAGRRIAQAIQDRRALGRPQHHVERRHRVATMRAAEELPVSGWPPSNIRRKPTGDASLCNPREAAPAPYHRPGDSP